MDNIVLGMMKLAEEISAKSNCARRRVGAVITVGGEVVSVGWNGVNPIYTTCIDAGCPRCIDGGEVGSGYDRCICIHAEQKAIATAAARGICVAGASAYITLRPCFGCLTLMHESGIRRVLYGEHWTYLPDVEVVYARLASEFDAFGLHPVVVRRTAE